VRGKVNEGEISSRSYFYAGNSSGKDGWWTCEDLVAQLKNNAFPLFELLHPGCTGLFTFDQSANHRVFGRDALVASRMSSTETPYKEGPNSYRLRNTFYHNFDGQKVEQELYIMRTYSKKAVLADRKRDTRISVGNLIQKHSFKEVRIFNTSN
jgi:hypothetical protein